MTSQTPDTGHTLLLRRVSAHIGMSCFLYLDFVLSRRNLVQFELDVLSRIFTSTWYSDDLVNHACHIAHNQRTTSVVSLLAIIHEAIF
jgi:hypothetical protein